MPGAIGGFRPNALASVRMEPSRGGITEDRCNGKLAGFCGGTISGKLFAEELHRDSFRRDNTLDARGDGIVSPIPAARWAARIDFNQAMNFEPAAPMTLAGAESLNALPASG